MDRVVVVAVRVAVRVAVVVAVVVAVRAAVRAAVVVAVRAVVVVAVRAAVVVEEAVVAVATGVAKDPSRSSRFVGVRASSRVDAGSAFRLWLSSATSMVESAGDTGKRPRCPWPSRRRSRMPTAT